MSLISMDSGPLIIYNNMKSTITNKDVEQGRRTAEKYFGDLLIRKNKATPVVTARTHKKQEKNIELNVRNMF